MGLDLWLGPQALMPVNSGPVVSFSGVSPGMLALLSCCGPAGAAWVCRSRTHAQGWSNRAGLDRGAARAGTTRLCMRSMALRAKLPSGPAARQVTAQGQGRMCSPCKRQAPPTNAIMLCTRCLSTACCVISATADPAMTHVTCSHRAMLPCQQVASACPCLEGLPECVLR